MVNNTVFLFIVAPSDSVTHCHHLLLCCLLLAAAATPPRVTTTAANARAKATPSVHLG